MNDTTIERMLFHAPAPMAPPDLLKQLQAGIALPRAMERKQSREARQMQNPLRRWFPALAFSVILLSCAMIIAVQGNWTSDLKRQNEALRVTAAELPQLRERHAVYEKAQAQREELEPLRKDNEEMHRLEAEVSQLHNLTGQIQRLRSENQKLASSLKTIPTTGNTANFFAEAQQDADRIKCINNLKQIGLAMRIWAGDNNDKYPSSFVVMSNELSTVKVLLCPGDKGRSQYSSLSFRDFQDQMSSYQFISQPDDMNYPECVTVKCPIHHNYLLADGSVQSINPDKVTEVMKDGRMYLQQNGPAK